MVLIVWLGFFLSIGSSETYLHASDEDFYKDGSFENHYGFVLESFYAIAETISIPLVSVSLFFWTLMCYYVYLLLKLFKPNPLYFLSLFFFSPFVLGFSHTFTQDIVIMSLATIFFYYYFSNQKLQTIAALLFCLLAKISGFFLIPLLSLKLSKWFPKWKWMFWGTALLTSAFVFAWYGLSLAFDYKRIFLLAGLPMLFFYWILVWIDWKENKFKTVMLFFLATVLFSSFYFALPQNINEGPLLLIARYSLLFYPVSVLAVSSILTRKPFLWLTVFVLLSLSFFFPVLWNFGLWPLKPVWSLLF